MSVDMQNFIEPEMVKIIHQKPEKTMTIEMVHLPKGTSIIGEEDKYVFAGRKLEFIGQREVMIDYEFEIGKYLVTFDEYDVFCEDTNREKPHDEDWGRGKRPVINVSWYDAVAFCKWLSEKSNQNYRLPTEIEWEYACRAGTTTKWSFGDDEKELDKYAWYVENSNATTHSVGEKFPNPWGLYDMHGNVWEWCQNWYEDKEYNKVYKGGTWNINGGATRSAYESMDFAFHYSNLMGFRLLRTLP